jgi:predicted ATPase
LSNAASARVVANLLGSAGLSVDVVERIVVAAEGNPLYVEQMLSMLIDSGALRRNGEHWERAEGTSERRRGISDTVRRSTTRMSLWKNGFWPDSIS